jgi:hypothetical protein
MKKGTRVKWVTAQHRQAGQGVTISDEDDGHVLVAILVQEGVPMEIHFVIWCAVTWLEEIRG